MKICFNIIDSNVNKLVCRDFKDGEAIHIDVAATFAGVVTSNKMIYLPIEVKKMVDSFTSPYGIPLLWAHDDKTIPFGRCIAARYEDLDADVPDEFRPAFYDDGIDFSERAKAAGKYAKLYPDGSNKGLGRIVATFEVIDETAIKHILDGRFRTFSMAGSVDNFYCSVCGKHIVDCMAEEGHGPGKVYGDALCVLVPEGMRAQEGSFVNAPALPNSQILRIHEFSMNSNELQNYDNELILHHRLQ